MDFLANYGIFLAELLTVLLVLLALIGFVVFLITKGKEPNFGLKLKVRKLNTHFAEVKELLHENILSKAQHKKLLQNQKKTQKREERDNEKKSRLFVLNFEGDIKASAVQSLSELITAVLLVANKHDEVLVRLESAGGLVNAYGLAASQLQRLRDAKIKLTIAVDKMAASGGYMMACVADKVLAAPFAIIGSIGVVAQLPNFHRFLEKNNIDFEQITAGEYKRSLSLFGENTEKGREKVQSEVDDVQKLFKSFIKAHRPHVNVDQVATGEHWFAQQAIELNLVDELKTSDDYLLAAKDHNAIYELHYKTKVPLLKRLGTQVDAAIAKYLMGIKV
ncbi:MAG TPA: protease SohB [Coxiellaceae bacterium]|nr:protease SohB [Coxiellaceae bacterium]